MHNAAGGTSQRLKPAFATVCSRSRIPPVAPPDRLPALSSVVIQTSLQPPYVGRVCQPTILFSKPFTARGPRLCCSAQSECARIEARTRNLNTRGGLLCRPRQPSRQGESSRLGHESLPRAPQTNGWGQKLRAMAIGQWKRPRYLATETVSPRTYDSDPAAQKRPRLAERPCPRNRGRRERRVPNAPAASRARFWKHTSIVTTGTWKIRHSLRNGFNGLFRDLLGDRAFLPPSLSGELHQTWRQRRGVRTTQLCRPHQVLFVDALFARPTLLRPPHPIPRS